MRIVTKELWKLLTLIANRWIYVPWELRQVEDRAYRVLREALKAEREFAQDLHDWVCKDTKRLLCNDYTDDAYLG